VKIAGTVISSLEIPIFSLPEQRRIVRLLTNRMELIRMLTENVQTQLDLLEQLPAALLRQAFNGEL
jgi:restriction endonuclease S subunit